MKTELAKNVEKTEKKKWSGRFPWGSDNETDSILKNSCENEGKEKKTEDSTEALRD